MTDPPKSMATPRPESAKSTRPQGDAMTIQPEHQISRHRATAQEAARAAQEVLAEIEKLRAAAQVAADSEKCTQWLTRHAQRLEVLARKAQRLADAATEA